MMICIEVKNQLLKMSEYEKIKMKRKANAKNKILIQAEIELTPLI